MVKLKNEVCREGPQTQVIESAAVPALRWSRRFLAVSRPPTKKKITLAALLDCLADSDAAALIRNNPIN